MPPVAVSVLEKGIPAVAVPRVIADTLTEGVTTLMVNAFVTDLAVASVARRVKVAKPAAVGVPEIVPVDAKLKPTGSAPEASDQVTGDVPSLDTVDRV
ncbi:hypothetical protein F183_A28780 [Bryobacterales bacterium F-183]|nr:hypothetical protein F183_A28780 [Bryobacterales bacterium F-183]